MVVVVVVVFDANGVNGGYRDGLRVRGGVWLVMIVVVVS